MLLDIDRINFLANKSKKEGPSEEEKAEQQQLRKLYIEQWRKGVEQTLDNTYVMDSQGNKVKLERKGDA